MALFNICTRSACLRHNVQLSVIIPDECGESDVPVIYLLHGMYNDHTGWLRGTLVERYARERKIAVVLADAENSYYTDQVYGERYETFFAEELPAWVHKWFAQVTTDPQKTMIGGFSMGGYGALKLALQNPARYGGVMSLSGVVDLARDQDKEIDWEDICVCNWGENFRATLPYSRHDLFTLLERNVKEGVPLPRLYLACGTEDDLFAHSKSFWDYARSLSVSDICFEGGAGAHNWEFWNAYLPKGLDHLLK